MKKIFITTDSELVSRNGQKVEIINRLSATECDIVEVGLMYKVKFPDECTKDAFEDELFDFKLCDMCGGYMIAGVTNVNGEECPSFNCECGNSVVKDDEYERIEKLFDK